MSDRLFFVVLVLNATGFFRFLAPPLGVAIGDISLALLLLNLLYVAVKARYSMALLLSGRIGTWLFVLILWPLLTMLYAPSVEIREVGLQLYYFSLFLGAVVYTMANGLPAMHRVFGISLVITIVGLALSMLAPQYFEAVAALAEARAEEMGRPLGFFMQPNRLAVSASFLFVGWFALSNHQNTVLEVGAILGFLLMILVTGSRAGIVMAVIIVIPMILYSWQKWILSGRYLAKICLLLAGLVGGAVGMNYYVSNVGDTIWRRPGDLIDRMETLSSFKLSAEGSLKDDVSVQKRLETQAVYWGLAKEKPVRGHGFGSDTCYQRSGRIYLSAHSDALTCAMEYGVLYPFVYALLMIRLYTKRSRRHVEGVFQTNSILQFVFALLFIFAVSGGLFENRTFYVVWGMFFAAVYCPRYVFSYDERTGRFGTCMTRREISKRFSQRRGGQQALEPSM